MKKLSDYAVEVSTDTERNLAIEFFKRASHKPVNPLISSHGRYVGMSGMGVTYPSYKGSKSTICCSSSTYYTETIIPFAGIAILADSPARQEVFNKVFGKTFDIN